MRPLSSKFHHFLFFSFSVLFLASPLYGHSHSHSHSHLLDPECSSFPWITVLLTLISTFAVPIGLTYLLRLAFRPSPWDPKGILLPPQMNKYLIATQTFRQGNCNHWSIKRYWGGTCLSICPNGSQVSIFQSLQSNFYEALSIIMGL